MHLPNKYKFSNSALVFSIKKMIIVPENDKILLFKNDSFSEVRNVIPGSTAKFSA